MKEKNNNIKTEVAIGIIVIVGVIFTILIYRAGSFTEALNYIPMVSKKKEKPAENSNWVLFAEKGDRKVYKVQKDDGQWAVVIDGQVGEGYDEVFNPTFSDDGAQFAYGARNDEWEFVVLNNKASEQKYTGIGQIIFDHDGVLIYKVISADGEFLVIDGKEGEKYTSIGEIVILDDGRVAYQAEVNGEKVTIIDGQVVTDNQGSGDGQSGTGTPGGGSGNNPPVVITPSSKPPKENRVKKDWVIPVAEKSYPVCNGVDCNF